MFAKGPDQIPPVLAVLILNDKGERIAVQYSPRAARHAALVNDEARKTFEGQLVAKARKASVRLNQVEVVTLNEYLVLYRYLGDASIIVIGDTGSNEILLLELAESIYDALKARIGEKMGCAQMLKRLDQVLLSIDEFVESGYINELKHKSVLNRIAMIE